MEFYLLGLWITGAIFMVVPWDSIPVCLPQIYLETVARETASTRCILTSEITRLLGVGTILCMLPPLLTTNRKIIAGVLIIAGLLALVIIFIYLVRPGNCTQPILPCRTKDILIVSSVGLIQLLLAAAGLKKILRRR